MPIFAVRACAERIYSAQATPLLPKLPGPTRIAGAALLAGALFCAAPAARAQSEAPPAPAAPATQGTATAAPPSATAPSPAAPATATTPAVPAPNSAPAAATDVSQQQGPEALPGTGSALIPHDLSPYGMFAHADVVVKAVMIGLALASLATWTVLLVKLLELTTASRGARRGLLAAAEAATLSEAAGRLEGRKSPVARFVDAVLAEAERSRGLPVEGTKERAAALLGRMEGRAGRAMTRGTGFLATVGSTAPFIGLFGTVWGIMNSFIGISKTNTTNLAVVAPGIAEALLATATGLVAAIPAVIIFNAFARSITGYRQLLGDASTEVLRLLSRDLDRDEVRGRGLGRQAAE